MVVICVNSHVGRDDMPRQSCGDEKIVPVPVSFAGIRTVLMRAPASIPHIPVHARLVGVTMALKRYHCFKSSVSYEGTTGYYVKEANVPND
jgi:hypothetical protein